MQNILSVMGETFAIVSSDYDLIAPGNERKGDNVPIKCFSSLLDRKSPCPGCPVSSSLESRQPVAAKIYFEPLQRFMFVKSFPLADQAGKVIVQHEDLTELTQDPAILDQIFEGLPFGMLITNKELKIVYASPGFTKLFPFILPPVSGKDARLVISRHQPPFPKKLLDFFFTLSSHSVRQSEEFELAYPYSRAIRVLGLPTHQEATFFASGDGFLILFMDYTEEKIRQSIATQRKILKETQRIFAETFSHVIPNLENILSLIQTLTEKEAANLEDKTLLRKIHQESRQLNKQLKALKALNRGKSATLKEINLHLYIQKAAKDLAPLFKSNDVHLKTQFTRHLKTFYAPPGLMTQILKTLLQNALEGVIQKRELSDESYDPAIKVQTKMNGSEIELAVKDNGIGMDDGEISQAFLPGFTTKNPSQHAGMGLFLCQTILHALLNGDIQLSSVKGVGTKVTIKIPSVSALHESNRVNRENGEKPRKKPVKMVNRGLFEGRVLWLLGAHDSMQEYVEKFLQANKATIRVISGAQGLENHFKRGAFPDAIILNITNEDEAQTLALALKEKQALEKTLFLTPEELFVSFKKRYKKTGARFIRKPFPIETFVDHVINLFGNEGAKEIST